MLYPGFEKQEEKKLRWANTFDCNLKGKKIRADQSFLLNSISGRKNEGGPVLPEGGKAQSFGGGEFTVVLFFFSAKIV